MVRRLPGASFAAGRWKVSARTDGGEAPGTSLSSASPRPPQIEPQIAPDPRGSQSAERVACSCFFSFFFSQGAKLRGRELAVRKLFWPPDNRGKNGVEETLCGLPSLTHGGWEGAPPPAAGTGPGEEIPAHSEEVASPPVPAPAVAPLTKRTAPPRSRLLTGLLGPQRPGPPPAPGRELSGHPQG